MHINLFFPTDGYKIHFFIILFAYIHFIPPSFQLQTDQILQHTCNQPVTIAHHGINQRKVAYKILLIRLQNFLSFNIISGNTLNDKSTFQCIQIIIDGIHIHLPLLTFEVIGYIFSVQLIAYIIENKLHYPFEQFHIPDIVTLHRVTKNDRRIDVVDNFIDSLISIIGSMYGRKSSHTEIFLKFLLPVERRIIGLQVMESQIFSKRQGHDMESDIPSR